MCSVILKVIGRVEGVNVVAWFGIISLLVWHRSVYRTVSVALQHISVNVYRLPVHGPESAGRTSAVWGQQGGSGPSLESQGSPMFSNQNLTSHFPNVTFPILFIRKLVFFFSFFLLPNTGRRLTFNSGASGGTRGGDGGFFSYFELFRTFIGHTKTRRCPGFHNPGRKTGRENKNRVGGGGFMIILT